MGKLYLLLVLAILTSSINGYSQKDLKKKKIKNNNIIETFHVLKDTPSIRSGSYKKIVDGTICERGQFHNNLKTGIWIYSQGNHIEFKYDFDNNLYIVPTPFRKDKDFVVLNENRNACYFGSSIEFLHIIATNLRYPQESIKNKKIGRVYISITIDNNGRAISYNIEKSVSALIDREALRVVKLIPNNWICALENGKAVTRNVLVPINFYLE